MVQTLRAGWRGGRVLLPPSRRGEIVRRAYKHLVLFALLTLFAGLGMTASQTDPSHAQTVSRPNILFILLDDMNVGDLKYMPYTQQELVAKGVKFENAFVSRSLCCPSRSTILRGQYTHNHQVWVNVNPTGGFWKFYDLGHENSTVATWLNNPAGFNDGGYDTVLLGKYLNRYGLARDGTYAPTTHVPPGWDEWYAWEGMYTGTNTDYDLNENGQIVTYQRSQIHDTDLHRDQAVRFLTEHANDPARKNTPFFMYLAPNAPHKPAYSAPEDATKFSSEPLPKPPNFNEADVSDKPKWVQNKSLLSSTTVNNMTTTYRKRLRALQSVDRMVKQLVDTLSVKDPVTGQAPIDNTYIVFTSDNGDYFGEHRLQEKAAVYEEDIRVPLLVRGPGVPQGRVRSELVLNNDLAPTFASWAGVTPPSFVDGRALSPLLSEPPSPSWRSHFLIEHRKAPEEYAYVRAIPEYYAVRTSRYLYVEYPTTKEKEFYDLSADPYQLTNTYNSVAGSPLLSDLQAKLAALKQCTGAGPSAPSCEAAEGM
jgi:N-acetylglucosamine-6-sulfatase